MSMDRNMNSVACPLFTSCVRDAMSESTGREKRMPIKATLLCCVKGETVYIDTHDGKTKEEEEESDKQITGKVKTDISPSGKGGSI